MVKLTFTFNLDSAVF